MRRFTLVAAIAIAAVYAQTGAAEGTHHPSPAPTAAANADMAEGEVRKIDKDTGRITIKHGPLVNLDMPAMTMVFRAQDPAMLDQVEPGDKIRFVAEKIGGAYVVVELETVR